MKRLVYEKKSIFKYFSKLTHKHNHVLALSLFLSLSLFLIHTHTEYIFVIESDVSFSSSGIIITGSNNNVFQNIFGLAL